MSEDLHFLTIAQAAAKIESGALSPVELVQAYLARIEAIGPQLDAFITLTAERAIEQARAAEHEIVSGKHRGPMHGIPFGLKDIYDTAGIPTTGHSKVFADNVPAADATTTARMYQAGAVLLGKLATHEFAHGGPSFDLPWPPARNPWNRDHFTGGSSSGSGAAVAAGLLPGALGSDTGGSIRGPAALCGIVGLKPTYGLVSRHGVIANSYTYDHAGPLSWTVEDAAIMLQVLAGHDPKDPASTRHAPPDYRAALGGDLRGVRIGVVRHFFEDDIACSGEVVAAMDAAIEVLEDLGAQVRPVRLRPAQDFYDVKIVGAESELYSVHEANLRTRLHDFGEDFVGRSLAACLLTSADYVNSQRERRRILAQMAPIYERFDVLITAGAPGPAPLLTQWRTVHFWQKPSLATPFNVTAGPALVQCMGFSNSGLPLSLQIVARPFDEPGVLKVADAYERATQWRARRPLLTPVPGFRAEALPVPDPVPAQISGIERDHAAVAARRAGLTLNERQFELLCASKPYVDAMASRLRTPRDWREEPSNVFQFPAPMPSC